MGDSSINRDNPTIERSQSYNWGLWQLGA